MQRFATPAWHMRRLNKDERPFLAISWKTAEENRRSSALSSDTDDVNFNMLHEAARQDVPLCRTVYTDSGQEATVFGPKIQTGRCRDFGGSILSENMYTARPFSRWASQQPGVIGTAFLYRGRRHCLDAVPVTVSLTAIASPGSALGRSAVDGQESPNSVYSCAFNNVGFWDPAQSLGCPRRGRKPTKAVSQKPVNSRSIA